MNACYPIPHRQLRQQVKAGSMQAIGLAGLLLLLTCRPVLAGEAAVATPPANAFAPRSSWPEGHAPYAQQWSPVPGPVATDRVHFTLLPVESAERGITPSGTVVSERDALGHCSFWGTNGRVLYKVVLKGEDARLFVADPKEFGYGTLSGYWTMDRDNVVYVMDGKARQIIAFTHADPADFHSGFRVKARLTLPEGVIQTTRIGHPRNDFKESVLLHRDTFLGIKLLYSGELVVTTRAGKVLVLNRALEQLRSELDLGEPIDNSMSVDEDGGIYVTTFRRLLRLRWDGSVLSQDWSVEVGGRSGSTPTLMGIAPADDRLVAITADDQPIKLWLVWRRAIPADWQGLAGLDRRIAARVPVTYGGDPSQSRFTENSLLVYGHGVLAANWTGLFPALQAAHPGVARYDWDSRKRELTATWVRKDLWLPNSMQALSAASGLIYAIGVRGERGERQWGLYGLRWTDGRDDFFAPAGEFRRQELNIQGSGIQLGPNREVITTSPNAVLLFRP